MCGLSTGFSDRRSRRLDVAGRGLGKTVIRYGRLPEVRVYEVSEAELDELESGLAGQIYLNFALALLPAALTVLITLQTVEIQNPRLYIAYWIAFWCLSLRGLLALAQWYKRSGSLKAVAGTIRARVSEEPGVPDPAAVPPGQNLDARQG